MKDSNYILIQGFMINQLNLKSNELLLFAIIYGFSQDESSEFTGSINYLCSCLSCSRNTVIKGLKSLLEKELITKKQETKNNITFNKYSVIDGVVQKLTKGSAKTAQGGSAKTAPNNTNINNTNINKRILEFEKSLIPFVNIYKKQMLREFSDYWCEYSDGDKKFRKEKEKTFGLKRRLATWHNSEYNKHKNESSKTIKEQTAHIKNNVGKNSI